MTILRCVGQKIHAYRRDLLDGHTEWAIVFTTAGILLSAGDSLCSWLLSIVAPSLALQFNALEKGQRVLFVGAPSTVIFLAAIIGIRWWERR